jgi:hypothetical protein
MEHDTTVQSLPGAYDPKSAALFLTKRLYILTRASNGSAADDELRGLIQDCIDQFEAEGTNVPVGGRSPPAAGGMQSDVICRAAVKQGIHPRLTRVA